MIDALLPDIPRVATGVAEGLACVMYILLVGRRHSWPHTAALIVAGIAALVAVQLVAEQLPREFWTLGMAAAVATMLGFITLTASVSLREAGDLTARAFVLAELVASLHWQLHVFFFRDSSASTASWALMVVIYGGAVALVSVVERRHFPRGRKVEIDTRALVGAVAVATATFLMSNLSFVTASTPFSGRIGPEVFYIRTLVDLCGFVVLFALRGQRLEFQRTAEAQAATWMLESQRERYLQSKHDTDAVNRKYHDLKHFIHAIRAEADPTARAEYVDQLESSIRGYEQSALDTGSAVLDTLLTAKQQEADRQGITLTCVADGGAVDFVAPMDLVALVGNALDNAIDAVAVLPELEGRLVKAAIFQRGNLTMLTFENYFVGSLDLDDGLPRTSKGAPVHHGYGLRSMRTIAEGYGGSLTTTHEHNWFSVQVLLPRPR